MDWGMVGAVVGAVGLLGVLVALATYRRQFPKRRLVYRAELTPLLSNRPESANLEVSLAGQAISDPYLLRITIRSESRADISSADFDAASPITFSISPDPFVLSQTERTDGAIGITWSSNSGFMSAGSAQIEPQLIRKGAEGEFVVVTDGRPTINPQTTLVNIPVRFDAKLADTPKSLQTAVSVILGGVAASFIAEFWASTTVWGSYLGLTGGLIVAVASTYGIVIMHAERRYERQQQRALTGHRDVRRG